MSDKETLDQIKNVVKLLKENERLEAELLKAEAKGVALLETVVGLMAERDGLKDAIEEIKPRFQKQNVTIERLTQALEDIRDGSAGCRIPLCTCSHCAANDALRSIRAEATDGPASPEGKK